MEIVAPWCKTFSALWTESLSINLEGMLTAQYNCDFNDKKMGDEQMSREVRFMEIFSHSVDSVSTSAITASKCLLVAKQKILGLKRRFEKEEQFHQEDTSFFTDITGKMKIPRHLFDSEDLLHQSLCLQSLAAGALQENVWMG